MRSIIALILVIALIGVGIIGFADSRQNQNAQGNQNQQGNANQGGNNQGCNCNPWEFCNQNGVCKLRTGMCAAVENCAVCSSGSSSCGSGRYCDSTHTCTSCPIEVCDDGIDNDCDGTADEGCCTPSPEVCDGKDNDCDGAIDESCCTPSTELCDGIDNNCNGLIDEGCICDDECCLDIDRICNVNSDCCSNYCYKCGYGHCKLPGSCTVDGIVCSSNSDCCSGNCHPTTKKCYCT